MPATQICNSVEHTLTFPDEYELKIIELDNPKFHELWKVDNYYVGITQREANNEGRTSYNALLYNAEQNLIHISYFSPSPIVQSEYDLLEIAIAALTYDNEDYQDPEVIGYDLREWIDT